MGDIDGGEYPTLMKAGPPRSKLPIKNPYHHNVPVRSLSLSLTLDPIQITGMVKITGTKISARWRNLNPVATGSTT
jgi:hypothetical protein